MPTGHRVKPKSRCANCGKSAKRPVLVTGFDLSELAALPAMIERMRVYRCTACAKETIAAPDIERVLAALTVAVVAREERLTGAEARFLRKRLGMTQDELAPRIDANKVTISDWERGAEPISTHYDYILRGLVFASLKTMDPRVVSALGGVHKNVPKTALMFVVRDVRKRR